MILGVVLGNIAELNLAEPWRLIRPYCYSCGLGHYSLRLLRIFDGFPDLSESIVILAHYLNGSFRLWSAQPIFAAIHDGGPVTDPLAVLRHRA